MNLHILANPHGITNLIYRMEPFNIAVAKMIRHMTQRGHTVTHYGHELSQVDCETVPVVTRHELVARGENDLFAHNPAVAALFCQRTNQELRRRTKPGDLVLCFYGTDHQPAVTGLDHVRVVEPSIGYRTECVFAPYRVFTSYAQMHYFYGQRNLLHSPSWTDDVIPNAFDPDEFEYRDTKQDYLLYLGRVTSDKGVALAIQVAQAQGRRLIIAGPGDLRGLGYDSVPPHVTMVGYVNVQQRRQLLAGAQALIAPTHYIEPFGNIVAEAQFSGTPVITTDWGGFVDTNQDGVTGFRCRTFQEFCTAVDMIRTIQPQACRQWAMEHYTDAVVHDHFDNYFTRISQDFYHGKNIQ